MRRNTKRKEGGGRKRWGEIYKERKEEEERDSEKYKERNEEEERKEEGERW